MEDNFTLIPLVRILHIKEIITFFHMELPKDFRYDGESHNFWELVYIDKGEMICQADKKRFLIKSGEITFHKPNEFHNLSGNGVTKSSVIIITFGCRSQFMAHFEGKIFKLNSEEKNLFSQLFNEGISCYQLKDEQNPLTQNMIELEDAPLGASQCVKSLFEVFLIRLARRGEALTQAARRNYIIDGIDIPRSVKDMVELLNDNIYGRLTIADIASRLGMSESTVKQLFSRHFKQGIIHYYNSLKIAEAKKLIRESKYTFGEISDMLCFESPQYFSKSFKKNTGRTPSEYRASVVK